MRRIVLRLLLCLMVVLNGTGYAVAATQMHLAHVANAVATQEADAVPPCHEAAASKNAATSAYSHAADPARQADPGVPSCCQSSLCNCDCLQHATAAMAVIALPAGAPIGAGIAQPRVVDRLAPALPNLLRPPIA